MQVVPIILSGGAGARLWPLTQSTKAKPMLKLPNGNTLLCETFKRAEKLASLNSEQGLILTTVSRNYSIEVIAEANSVLKTQLKKKFIIEPCARDTAPTIVLSALHLKESGLEQAVLFVMPADHSVDKDAFLITAKKAIKKAELGNLVSIGVSAHEPNPRYGYMQVEDGIIKKFIEKPELELAKQFVNSKNYFWNTGLFCCRVDRLLELLNTHCVSLVDQCKATLNKSLIQINGQVENIFLDRKKFEKITPISIDHALMMKLNTARCIQSDMQWSDVGSWDSYGELFNKDADGNLCFERGFAEESQNCFAFCNDRPIAMVGLNNVVVVDTKDGVLVANKKHSQSVKKIREQFRKRKSEKIQRVWGEELRPWGHYEVLSERKNYKVKRLVVEPFQALSLQSHEFRAEHWMVVEGAAKVQLERDVFELGKNQHVDIPSGAKHRISNPHSERLVFIETQTGTYFGEDDETRYEDNYGRTNVIPS